MHLRKDLSRAAVKPNVASGLCRTRSHPHLAWAPRPPSRICLISTRRTMLIPTQACLRALTRLRRRIRPGVRRLLRYLNHHQHSTSRRAWTRRQVVFQRHHPLLFLLPLPYLLDRNKKHRPSCRLVFQSSPRREPRHPGQIGRLATILCKVRLCQCQPVCKGTIPSM